MTVVINGTTGITTPKLDALDLELGSKNVVESGSNANGTYVRFADGTQICTAIFETTSSINVGPLDGWFYGIVSRQFPAIFLGLPAVAGTARFEGYLTGTLGAGTSSTAFETFLILPVSRGASVYQIGYIAIGRWY